MLSFVVAVSQNNVIGKDNNLPWKIPEDLKHFKEITLSKTKTMIMGRKTFEALPSVLPRRKHIVLTGNRDYNMENINVKVIHSVDEINPLIHSKEEYFVIGGGEIFSELMPYAKKIYLTIIHHDFQGDTFFPGYNKNDWKITEMHKGTVDENNKFNHTYLTLEKI
ncbi:MAG: dihydrofolate reductase [Clostridium sp.]|nr:dihydrofolate reductase [Clostridium sp.]